MRNPIDLQEQEPGFYRVTYLNSEAGWINDVKVKNHINAVYRAMTIDGRVMHCETLDTAKLFIVENYQS
jgi:hypothetical protein